MQSLLLKFLSELRLQIYNYVMPAVPLSKPRSQYSWRIEVRVAGDRSILRGGTVYGEFCLVPSVSQDKRLGKCREEYDADG